MAPRTRAAKAEPKPGARSTALVFLEPQPEPEPVSDPKPSGTEGVPNDDDEDDISQSPFPLRIIYTVQDFLNDNLDTAKFVQLMVCGYILQIMYLNNTNQFWETYQLIGYNLAGVAIALVLAHNSLAKNHAKFPEKFPYLPQLPEFQHIYSVLIPLCLVYLLNPQELIQIMSFNYFIIDNLSIWINLFTSFMFSYIYGTEDLDIYMVKSLLCYTAFRYFIQYVNEGEPTEIEVIEEIEIELDASDYEESEEEENDEDDAEAEVLEEEIIVNIIDDGYAPKPKVTLSKAETHLISLLLAKLVTYDYFPSSPEDPLFLLVILRALLASLIGAGLALYPVYLLFKSCEPKKTVADNLAGVIIGGYSSIIYFLTDYQLKPFLDGQNAVVWLADYIAASPRRLRLVGIWASIILSLMTFVFTFANKVSINWRRKVWHLAIFGILWITDGIAEEPTLTLISLVGSAFLMIVVEMFRYTKFTWFGELLNSNLRLFQDQKDLEGPLNLSYIFLLVGVSIPIFLNNVVLGRSVSEYSLSGLIFLGIGDTFASFIGQRYGTFKWQGSQKSVQGSAAFFISTFIAFVISWQFLGVEIEDWEAVFVSCLIGALLEGTCEMNDNLLIPVNGFIALFALNKKVIA